MQADDVRGRLDSMVLAVLEAAPLHGYAVIEAVRERSGGQLALTTGAVYPALRRLEDAGFLDGAWSVVDGRRRRSYRLTTAGLTHLAHERDRWSTFSAVVGQVLYRQPR